MLDDRHSKANAETVNVPDGGWGWIVVFSSFMIHFIMDGITYAMAEIYLEPMLIATNGTRASISAISSNLPAVTLAFGPVAAVFVNMYGCRIVTIVGACLAAAGFFLSRWWVNIIYYYITIGAMGGIGFGLIYEPALVSVKYYFKQKQSVAVGIAVSGTGFGTVAFPPLMHWMIKAVFKGDYRPALLTQAGIILTCVLFGALMIPLPQDPAEKRRVKRKAQKHANITKQNASNIEQVHQQQPLLRDQQQLESGMILASEECTVPKLSNIPPENGQSDEENQNLPSDDLSTTQKEISHQVNFEIDDQHQKETNPSDPATESVDVKQISFFKELRSHIGIKFLANNAFLLFTISNFMTSLGFNVPYNFARDLAKDAQVIEHQREYVIMAIGLSNALGRLIFGFLGDRKRINRLYLYNMTLIIAGIATISAPHCGSSVISHIGYASIFGFFSGGYVGLTLIIISDLVGVDNVSSALGIILLFQGIAVFIGTPLTGYMRDQLSKQARPFLWPYFIFGGFIFLSGIILFGIPALQRSRRNPSEATENGTEVDIVSSKDNVISSCQQQQQQI